MPENEIRGIPQVHVQDTGISALYQEASFYYSPKANVIALQIDNDKAQLNVGTIKAKDIAYNYQYAGGEITVYEMTGKDLKTYMEWSAGYFNSVKPGDVTYSFDPERRASKYSTNDFFAGVTYKIDLTQPKGRRITDLKFADGTPVKDDTAIRLGMNSYRMGHLTKQGGVLEGRDFKVLSDSKAVYGEEQGTIRNLTIRYLTEQKKGQYQSKPQKRWQLVGMDDSYNKEREVVKTLINKGKISVPSSEDGRYTNIASINVKGLKFANDQAAKEAVKIRQRKFASASDYEKQALERDIAIIEAIN